MAKLKKLLCNKLNKKLPSKYLRYFKEFFLCVINNLIEENHFW